MRSEYGGRRVLSGVFRHGRVVGGDGGSGSTPRECLGGL